MKKPMVSFPRLPRVVFLEGHFMTTRMFRAVAATALLAPLSAIIASKAYGDTYEAVVLADSPRGYFRLDQSTGATIAANNIGASGGAGMNGTYTNSPTLEQPGIPGASPNTAATFVGGSSQRVQSIADTYTYTAYSLEAWVRPSTVSVGQGIIVNTNGNPGSDWSNNVRIVNNGQPHFSFYVFDGSAKGFVSSAVVDPNQLYHVVAAATNGGAMQLYVNGALQTGTYYLGGSVTTPLTVGTLLNYGRWFFGSTAGSNYLDPFTQTYYSGLLDEVAIYPTVLSQATVQAHYTTGIAVPEPSTYAMALAGLACGGYSLFHRRKRA